MALAATLGYVPDVESTPASRLLAELVRAEAARDGLSITALERSSGVSHNAMYRLLRGEANVGHLVLRPLEKVLGLPVMFLSHVRDADLERVRQAQGVRPDLLKWVLDELDPTAEIVPFPGPRATTNADDARPDTGQAAARRTSRRKKSDP